MLGTWSSRHRAICRRAKGERAARIAICRMGGHARDEACGAHDHVPTSRQRVGRIGLEIAAGEGELREVPDAR